MARGVHDAGQQAVLQDMPSLDPESGSLGLVRVLMCIQRADNLHDGVKLKSIIFPARLVSPQLDLVGDS